MIHIKNLSRSFGEFKAVDDISLDIHAGEILGFLGPNGAGKTTTIRMISGLLEPDQGDIIWEDSGEPSNNRLGLCTQENIYWPRLTCLEQLAFQGQIQGLDAAQSRSRGSQLLEQLGLDSKAHVLASHLSGGMKRRLNIALALIHDPPTLIFDEPEAGLDPQSRILVRDLILQLSQSKTIILTTHNMDEAERLSHRVAIMDRGRILAVDTVPELKARLGEWDVLDLKLDKTPDTAFIQALSSQMALDPSQITCSGHQLLIKLPEAMEGMSRILAWIKDTEYRMEAVSLRPATLEDVFIHLTGRGLRE